MLNQLGQKIFLDRYALKETDRSKIQVGDLVIVTTEDHPKWPKRAVGHVTGVLENGVRIKYTSSEGIGEEREFPLTLVDICKETFDQAMQRVARGLASVEKVGQSHWTQEFYGVLANGYFVPAGRILTGAGSGLQVTYYSCYTLPSPQDSRHGIFNRLGQMAEVLARGGGTGLTFSSLRPRNAIIKGTMGKSSGSVSWANVNSHVIVNTSQGGSRRGAGMAQWNLRHPDTLEVIECKRTPGYMEGFNISLRVPDEFMKCLAEDGTWDFIFPDTEHPMYDQEWTGDYTYWKEKGYPFIKYGSIKAKELWNRMMEAAWASAEPGIVFEDTINKYSNSWYFNPLVSTNPCGEQPLPAWGVCTLGHINLAVHVKNGHVDWDQLAKTIALGVRMLDNVVDATPYFFKENEDVQKHERRIGMGTLGLGEMLIKLGIRYGNNEKCLNFLDDLYSWIAKRTYSVSCHLAAEKGPFPAYDADKFLQSEFMKRMIHGFPNLENALRIDGIRNVTLITQAPTGTVGTMLNTSTGIEPFYAIKFKRQSRLGVDVQYMDIAKDWLDAHPGEELPNYFVGAMDISPEDHLMVQAVIQKWTDSACSKTCNLPSTATVEQIDYLYRKAYDLGCKGFTVYRDGSRYEQVLHLEDSQEIEVNNIHVSDEPLEVHDYDHWKKTGKWSCPEGGFIKTESGCSSCSCGGFAVCG